MMRSVVRFVSPDWMEGRWMAAVLGLGLLRAVVGIEPGTAQVPATQRLPLAVQPSEMATGTMNPAAGKYPLDSLPVMTSHVRRFPYGVYVPSQCAGAHRCPLLVFLHGAGRHGGADADGFSVAAEKYGVMLLGPTASRDGQWAVGNADGQPNLFPVDEFEPDRKNLEAALQQVLHKFAVDPHKIAIGGVSQGCWPARILALSNPEIFSRTITFGNLPSLKSLQLLNAQPQMTEFLNVIEFPSTYAMGFKGVEELRRAGYRATEIHAMMRHGVHPSTADFALQWLQASWAQPDPAKRTPPRSISALPVLTPQLLTQFGSVSSAFQLPEELRLSYQRETTFPFLTWQLQTVMVDMTAVAAQRPEVAAALRRAGLAAQDYDAVRLALFTAVLALKASEGLQDTDGLKHWSNTSKGDWLTPASLDATSVLGQNVAFVKAHGAEVAPLAERFFQGP